MESKVEMIACLIVAAAMIISLIVQNIHDSIRIKKLNQATDEEVKMCRETILYLRDKAEKKEN